MYGMRGLGLPAIDPLSINLSGSNVGVLGGASPCTCVQGTCLEDGNSCSSGTYSAPIAPVSTPLITGLSNTTLVFGGLAVFILALAVKR
jgi:hypothetical protein